MNIFTTFRKNYKYALMRLIARFKYVRAVVAFSRRVAHRSKYRQHIVELGGKYGDSQFRGIDVDKVVGDLRRDGLAVGLNLSEEVVSRIKKFSESQPVFAFRERHSGFFNKDRILIERHLGREILLAQYFNVQRNCRDIAELSSDPVLNHIALKYFGSVPRFLGCNLWWTYPVSVDRATRVKHAHFFHRDVDDFRFLKFFFYLSDVIPDDGGHWAVRSSHRTAPNIRLADRFLLRRYDDKEIEKFYGADNMLEIVGKAGTGFAEDTLCVHKASTPTKNARLILQLQFGLFKFMSEYDEVPDNQLKLYPYATT